MSKRINLVVNEKRKKRWDNFVEKADISLSQLIRESVDDYIKSDKLSKDVESFSKYSHNLKEELSSIKGFSQMLIEEYKDQLDWEVLLKIKEIYDKSINIEKIMDRILNEDKSEKGSYDILIVDDDDSTVHLLSEFFRKRGFTTKNTSNGAETLEFLEYAKPKLILLDILLPDNKGYEICKKIKGDERLKDIPVYYITAVPKNEVNEKLKETQAEGYFSKPFDMVDFKELIESL
ncbi:MAG: Signal transduction response regulator [Promethearchaeota archaeon]|nr:MAG: Signal transduction response regulator [Candidatus Lokiarchaeota archaeon]